MDEIKAFFTKEGLQKAKNDLETFKTKTRPELVERLTLARNQGDLSENNEYASAKEELVFLDGRIEELEELLKNAYVLDETHKSCDCVGLGCQVTVLIDNEQNIYHIVGEWEADPVQRKVSHSSPLGQALLGKKIGEEVEFEAPAGKIIYKIVKIN